MGLAVVYAIGWAGLGTSPPVLSSGAAARRRAIVPLSCPDTPTDACYQHPPSYRLHSNRLQCQAGPGPGSFTTPLGNGKHVSRQSRLGASSSSGAGKVPAGAVKRPTSGARPRQTEPTTSSSTSWRPSISKSKKKQSPNSRDQGSREGLVASALGVLRSGGIETGRFGREGKALAEALAGGQLPRAPLAMGVLSELCRSRKPKVAAMAFQELAALGVGFGYMDYHRMVDLLVKAGYPQLARQTFRAIIAAGFSPNMVTYCLLISGLSKAARSRKRGLPYGRMAFELWKELESSALTLDAFAIKTGMNAAVGYGQYDAARQLLNKLQESGQLDSTAYNMLLKGFADCGRFKEAREVLDEMILSEVNPDAWTFSTLANAHVRGGDLSGARQVLRMGLDAGVEGEFVFAYTAILKGYAHAGQMEEVARLLNEMQAGDVAPTDITLAALVDALIGNSQMDRALGFVDILSREGVPITIAVKNNILSGMAKQDGIPVREALEMLSDFEAQEIMPNTDTYNILMGACCVAGEPVGARLLFKRMKAAGLTPDSVSYTTLMKAAIAEDNFEAALRVFEELEDSASGMEPDGVALNMLAFVLVSLERLPEARSVLDQVDAIAARTNTAPGVEGYGAVVMGFARNNLPEETVELMKRFRQRGGVPDQRMYNSVVGMYARSRDWTRALRVVKAMEQRGHEADKAMLISIIQRLEEAMELEARQAEKVARELNKDGQIIRKAPAFNEGFERFKFWLGLPNRYYNASWDEDLDD